MYGTVTPTGLSPPQEGDGYRSYVDALLVGDRQRCQASFAQLLEATPDLRTLYEDVVRRSLYEIGDRWECEQISVATEHMATAITEGLLNLAYPRLFAQPRAGGRPQLESLPGVLSLTSLPELDARIKDGDTHA